MSNPSFNEVSFYSSWKTLFRNTDSKFCFIVDMTMTQWFPKLAEFDPEGWHPNPYIGREFHGVWGNYKVNITIDKNYVVGGTGYLQNANEIGHGYSEKIAKEKDESTNTWKFYAPNVHDFAWAADPDYIHDIKRTESGVDLHFFYKPTELSS